MPQYARLSTSDIRASFILFALSSMGLALYEYYLQRTMTGELFEEFYFQRWASDVMMQTVDIHALRELGLLSFWYLHVQPPMYDFLRYALSFDGIGRSEVASGTILDGRIYLFYCLIYGGFTQLIYVWSRALGFQDKPAVALAILWAIYPGNLAMATLLDSTYLSAFLVAWSIFSLYLYLRDPSVGGLAVFLVIFLAASWTRSLFQLHFFILLLFTVAFFLFRFHRQKLIGASITTLPLAIAFFFLPLKQQYLYGTLATTTFAGEHEVQGIWYQPNIAEINAIEVPNYYIENAQKLQSKYNSVEQVVSNYRHEKIFRRILISDPILVLKGSRGALLQGLRRARIPTQDFIPNRLIETLPWANLSRRLSGGPAYLSVIVFGTVGYLLAIGFRLCEVRLRYLVIVGFIGLAFATIVVGSNRYSWTEAERLKFIIEAPVLLFSLHGIRLLLETFRMMIRQRRGVGE
jgi:hypothetical protein